MPRPRVFVARRIVPSGLDRLAERCEVDVWEDPLPPDRDTLLDRVRGADALLTMLSERVDGELLDAAGDQLKVVANYAVGYNNIDLSAAAERDVAVGNTPDVLTDATADTAVLLTLAAARRLSEATAAVRTGGWKTWEPLGYLGQELRGKTLGVVGLGRIGRATAAKLHGGWGMRVLYTARSPKPDADRDFSARHVELDELLAGSDVVSLNCPLTDATRGLIDAAAFRTMKPSAVLVNTARGEVVDQDALVAALRDGTIFGAGLDVTTPEPLPPDHPLVGLPNCTVLPHLGSATFAARAAMAEIAAANIFAGLDGEPLPHAVAA